MLGFAVDVFKVPVGIAGGVLVLWAAIVAGFGLSRPEFPGSAAGQRALIAVTVVLVAIVIGLAVQLG